MDECLNGLHHTTSGGIWIQQYFGRGGLILQVCCLCCNKDALQHQRSCEVVFQAHLAKYWGLPLDIVSDRDARFMSKFWTMLFKIVGTNLLKHSSYHPQIDGHTE
jgi:hypothetical protein